VSNCPWRSSHGLHHRDTNCGEVEALSLDGVPVLRRFTRAQQHVLLAALAFSLYSLAVVLPFHFGDALPQVGGFAPLPSGWHWLQSPLLLQVLGALAFCLFVYGAIAGSRGDRTETDDASPPEDASLVVPTHSASKGVRASLLDRDELLRGLLDHSSALIFALDEEGRILEANRRFMEWFDRDRRHIVGCSYQDLLPPDVAAVWHAHDGESRLSEVAIEREALLPFAG